MNRRVFRSIGVLACLLMQANLVSAQALRGTVTDRSGGVVAGASVQLSVAGRLLAETTTGASGEFTLLAPAGARADGEYTLLAAASGFAPSSQSVRLTEATGHKLEFVLDLAPYRQSLEVEAAEPVNQCSLDMTGVRESSAKDLSEALTALDGVSKIRKAGIANDLVIRGFQQNNINVLIDGARIYAACPSHMDPPPSHVDFAEVDHVDVTKGAFDMTNAGSLGAEVNIVTRRPDMGFNLKPSLSVGSFDFVNPSVTASYGNRMFQFLAGYSYRSSDPYKDGSGHVFTDYADYSALGKQQRAFSINTGWIQGYLALSDRQQLSFGYTRQQSGPVLYPYLMMDSSHDNADRVTLHYSARELTPLLRNLRIESYFTQVKHDMTDGLRTTAMMGQWSMAADASSQTIGAHAEGDLGRDFTIGVESYHRNWNMLSLMNMTGMLMATPAIPNVNTLASGFFIDYHHALTDRWKVSAGARFDHAQMRVGDTLASTNLYYQFHDTRRTGNMDNYASGDARITYGVTKSSQFFAGVGSTGRVPDAEERYLNVNMNSTNTVGNPLLPVTRNTEIAAGWSATYARFTLRPEFFYSFLENYILVNNQPQLNPLMGGGMEMSMPLSAARSYTNVDARMYGGEVGYTVALTGALSLNGGGSSSRGTATPVMAVNVMSRNLPEMPPLHAWSALRYTRQWAFAEFGAVAADRQSHVDTDLQESPTAGYSLLNCKLGLTHGRLSASFTLDNLLDRFYYEYLSYYRDPFAAGVKIPEPGRNVFGQVRYSF